MNNCISNKIALELNVFFKVNELTKKRLIDELISAWIANKLEGIISGIQSEGNLIETLNTIQRLNPGALQEQSKVTMYLDHCNYYDIVTLVNWYNENSYKLTLFR